MNKLILCFIILSSFSLEAETEIGLIKKLEKINNLQDFNQCAQNDTGEPSFYSPQKALADINSGKLTFMGRDKFPGSGQNYTCVFKSDKAYILYNNCMSSKKEAIATDIEVISFDGGLAMFYVQNGEKKGPISNLSRSDYDMSWKVMYIDLPPPGKLDVAGLKKYMNYDVGAYRSCYIGDTFQAQNKSSKGYCSEDSSSASQRWSREAEKFWLEPGQEWSDSQKSLRKAVVGAKF